MYLQSELTRKMDFQRILVRVDCDREGRVRALRCALTRKYGGTARGSYS